MIGALLSLVAPDVVSPGDVEPIELTSGYGPALSAPQETDWVARSPRTKSLFHVECQGYRDSGFRTRLFRYHLHHRVYYWPEPVHTFAFWLIVPPRPQAAGILRFGDEVVRVRTIVLPRVPAEVLLARQETLCFAPVSQDLGMEEDVACRHIARRMSEQNASFYARHMAVVSALMHSRRRYAKMIAAMEREHMEPVIIEDLVMFGEDLGYERGVTEGHARGVTEGHALGISEGRTVGVVEGLRLAIAEAVAARGWSLTPDDLDRLGRVTDSASLSTLLRLAISSPNVDRLRAALLGP